MITKPRTILVADDEKDIRFILRDTLVAAGYNVLEAVDGGAARELVHATPPDIILLDVRLPIVDGMTLLAEFKEEYPVMGVIIMTAHGSESLAVKAMKAGADDYLPKPFHPDDLLAVIERVLHHRDVERQRAHLTREIAREKMRLETIFSQMAQGIVTADSGWIITSCNLKAERILGRRRQEIIAHGVGEIIPTFMTGDEAPAKRLASGEESGNIETEIRRPDGVKLPLLVNGGGIRESGGTVSEFVLVFQDLTQIKALEREREEFVGMLAHDLKGPLTSVLATVELLLEGSLGDLTPKQREFIAIASSNAAKVKRMIDSFLEVFRMEAGKTPLQAAPLEPAAFIEPVYRTYLPVAQERTITLTLSLDPDLPKVSGDIEYLIRVMDNLLSNAVKFTPDRGTVAIEARRDPEAPSRRIRVSVVDSGVGLTAQEIPRIFDKFNQSRRRVPASQGSIGLGLAFCKMTVERHGGTIGVTSREGGGSTFFFTLPAIVSERARVGKG